MSGLGVRWGGGLGDCCSFLLDDLVHVIYLAGIRYMVHSIDLL